MQKLQALDPETTTGKSKELFNAIHQKLGLVPNMMRTMGNSPAVLEGYLGLSGALAKASVGAKLGELIALAVANVNQCGYCNAAHTFIGEKLAGIDKPALEDAKYGRSADAKTQAALSFANALVANGGRVSHGELTALRNAGYNDGAIAEIIAHVGLNIFTNYFNTVAETALDFPETAMAEAVVA